jgi:NAD(P)-dependent dehydrogenase (short-subunit alcohol dehydrogenase family)
MTTRKVALITGANRGIGLEIARQLGQQGHTVLVGSRDKVKGNTAVENLRQAGITDVHLCQLDVADEASRQAAYEQIRQQHGRLDILVNNAAIFQDKGDLLHVDLDLMRRTMEINAYAPLRLIQLFLPMMQAQGYGRIVNLSSGIGELGDLHSSYPTYRLSKIALNLFTRILAPDLKGTNIKMNAMCPGWVRTDMGGANATRSVEEGADTAVWLATLPQDGPNGGFFRDRQAIEW